jgi:hypothetical protein
MKKMICCVALVSLACGRTYTTAEGFAPGSEEDAAGGAGVHFGGEGAELGGADSGAGGAASVSGGAGGEAPAGGADSASGGSLSSGGTGGEPNGEECDAQPLSPLKIEPGKCSVTASVLYCVPGGPSELIVNGELRASDDFDAPGPVEWRLPEGLTEIVWLNCYPPGEGCEWDEQAKNWEGCL